MFVLLKIIVTHEANIYTATHKANVHLLHDNRKTQVQFQLASRVVCSNMSPNKTAYNNISCFSSQFSFIAVRVDQIRKPRLTKPVTHVHRIHTNSLPQV